MKRIFFGLFLLFTQPCFAAMSASIIWEFSSTATANMVNGGGFKTGATGTDYSLQNAAQLTGTDLTCTAASTTVTSATGGFTAAMIGNVIHLTALTGTGAIIGWYEITAYTDTNNIVLDRTPTNGVNNITAGTFYVGGALNVGALEDSFYEQCVAGQIAYIKNGTYSFGAVSVGTAVGTTALPILFEGYQTTRGDNPTIANSPTIACGANSFSILQRYWILKNLSFTGTGTTLLTIVDGCQVINCKSNNSSGTVDRDAVTTSNSIATINKVLYFGCEAVSTAGDAIAIGGTSQNMVIGCYIHNSKNGFLATTGEKNIIQDCIFDTFSSNAVTTGNMNGLTLIGNTFYGAETPAGTGVSLGDSFNVIFLNNIIYGFTTGVTFSSQLDSSFFDYNNYFNNTTARTNVMTGDHDTALAPGFTDAVNADFRVGANMKATAFPGTFPGAGASCIGYLDQGAVQRVEPTGGASNDVFGIM